MTKISDIDFSKIPPKVILYGPPGCGKTGLLLTLGSRLQVLDTDNGLRTAFGMQDKWRPQRLAVDAVQFLEEEPEKRALAFRQIKEYIYGLPKKIKLGDFPYEFIGIDSFTTFAKSAISFVMGNSGKLGQAPEIQHWGLAFIEVNNVLSVLRALPIGVILCVHEMINTVNKEEKVTLAIPGKNLPGEVASYFDEVWYMRKRAIGQNKFRHIIQTTSDEAIMARSRSEVPNETDISCGLLEIFTKLGYKPKEPKNALAPPTVEML